MTLTKNRGATPRPSDVWAFRRANPFSFKLLGTHSRKRRSASPFLSITCALFPLRRRVYPPSSQSGNSSPSLFLPPYSPFFQSLFKFRFCKSFIFRFIHVMGGGVPVGVPPTFQRADVPTSDAILSPYTTTSLPH